MRALLDRQLAVALAQGGWSPAVPATESPFVLAQFLRPLSDGLIATAEVHRARSMPDRLPVVITDLHVGVGYEPLRRLWSLLGERYRLALVHERVWPPQTEDEEDGDEDRCNLKVSASADAETAVAELAGVVLREAPSVTERYASVEQLLDEFGFGEHGGWVDQRAVALLAAAGRFEDAREALARYRPLTGYREGDREARRFVHQITRYIDSGGDQALVPSEPPPSPYTGSPPLRVSELWRQARARRQAVEAVRRMDPGTDRGGLRAALECELEARRLTESPLWYEQTLDHLRLRTIAVVGARCRTGRLHWRHSASWPRATSTSTRHSLRRCAGPAEGR